MLFEIGKGARGGAALAIAIALAGAGCGAAITSSSSQTSNAIWAGSDCPGDSQSGITPERVVLKWSGGLSPIYPNFYLDELDLDLFPTADGGTLGDNADSFRESVRREVANIYCGHPEAKIVVRNDDGPELAGDTLVYIAQARQPGGDDIGEAEYDPCNVQHDNSAIIFGERVLELGGAYTFDEWVSIFANVTAHEIGHTLGYGHVARADWENSGRSQFVELMLGHHTMKEMRLSQRFMADQTNCIDQSLARSRSGDEQFSGCKIDLSHQTH